MQIFTIESQTVGVWKHMPAVRQCARRSARLQANTRLRLRGMDPPPLHPVHPSNRSQVILDPGLLFSGGKKMLSLISL
jgi:hypothetical protein